MDPIDTHTAPAGAESWPHLVSRYAGNVILLVGIGCILSATLGWFRQAEDWASLLFFPIVGGAFWTWAEQRAEGRPKPGRRLAVVAGSALAIYVLGLVVAPAIGVSASAPTGWRAVVLGVVAIAGSLTITSRLEASEGWARN